MAAQKKIDTVDERREAFIFRVLDLLCYCNDVFKEREIDDTVARFLTKKYEGAAWAYDEAIRSALPGLPSPDMEKILSIRDSQLPEGHGNEWK